VKSDQQRGGIGLTLGPLEAESLEKRSIDRVSRNVSAAFGILRVAGAEITLDVEHRAGAARRDDSGNEIEGVAVGVVSTVDRTNKVRASGGLGELSLEIVDGLLRSGDGFVELIVTTIVYCSDSEGESRGYLYAEGQLAVLAIRADRDAGSDFSEKGAEGDRYGRLSSVENVVSRARRAP